MLKNKKAKSKQNGALKLTDIEQEAIEIKRKNVELMEQCSKELNELLDKHNCTLRVDPFSPLNNLRITVSLKA